MTTVVEPAPEKRGRGRPRSAALEARMLRAALEVLAENGFSGLTVERICAAAKVPKATFYLRWSAPIETTLEALRVHNRDIVLVDSGDLQADLFDFMKKLIALHHDPVMGACRSFFATEARVRPEIAAALRESGLARRARERAALEAAIQGQGYRPRVGADLILNVLNGVAQNATLEWRASDEEIHGLIAALLGPAGQGAFSAEPVR
jgi:AcrR family transcriptional regulator